MKSALSVAVVLLLVAVASLPAGSGETKTKWEDNTETETFVATSPLGGQWYKNFTVPPYAEIHQGTLRIRGDYYIMDEGQEYQAAYWPLNPTLDVFSDGTPDWKFPGTMGMQRNYMNNTEVDLRWESAGLTRYLDFKVPKSTVLEASLCVTNSQTTKFTYTAKLGERTVWQKDSLSFSFYDTSSTKESLNFVTAADVSGDTKNDLIGCGLNGKVYVTRADSKGLFGNAVMIDCNVESVKKDMLMVAVGDLDDSPGKDIVAACADGNFYFLLNQAGVGSFGGATKLETGAPGQMASVTIDDVDGDGDFDIVGGALNGKFYVALNNGGASFDTLDPNMFKVIKAGTGQMNDVGVADVNQDSFPDLVGANADKKFYVALGSGGSDLFTDGYPAVTGAGRDMNSVDAVDIDGDVDPDLIGASNDGKVYILLNLGGAQGQTAGEFDTISGHWDKITCESGTNSLRTSLVKDINMDGYADIIALGTSNYGQMYLLLNDGYGAFDEANLIKAFSAGQASKSLSIATLDLDDDLDIVVTNGARYDIYSNNQGKFTEPIRGTEFTAALQAYLEAAVPTPDEWGNPMVTVRLSISNRWTGLLRFSNLEINYSYSATVDFTSQLAEKVTAVSVPSYKADTIPVNVTFAAESAGKLNISELVVDYTMGLVARIENPPDGSVLYLNREMTLSGSANYDLRGEFYNYTWTELTTGRLLGYNSKRTYTPVTRGNQTIQLKVRDDLNGREATMRSNLVVEDEPAAALNVSKAEPSNRQPKEGETITIRVTIRNTGKVNATQVGFQVYLDREDSNPIASGLIPQIDVARSGTTDVYWQAAKPGDHKLIVRVVQCAVPFTTSATPFKTSIAVQPPVTMNVFLMVAGIIAAFAVVGVIGFIIKKKRDKDAALRPPEEQAAAAPAGAGGEVQQADYQSIYGTPAPAAGAEGGAAAAAAPAADIYAPKAEAAKVSACPRCGKPTDVRGVNCLECSAKEAILGARRMIEQVREMALDTDTAEELLKKAEAAQASGKHADAIESASEAEEEARTAKEAFEGASDLVTGKDKAQEEGVPVLTVKKPATGPVYGDSIMVDAAPSAPKPAPAPQPKPTPTVAAPKIVAQPAAPAPAPAAAKPVAAGAAAAAAAVCPSCGKPVQPRWKLCPHCQAKLG